MPMVVMQALLLAQKPMQTALVLALQLAVTAAMAMLPRVTALVQVPERVLAPEPAAMVAITTQPTP